MSELSSFFLLEASGDSEGDLHLENSYFYSLHNLFSMTRDDDAESCNCDSAEVPRSSMTGDDDAESCDCDSVEMLGSQSQDHEMKTEFGVQASSGNGSKDDRGRTDQGEEGGSRVCGVDESKEAMKEEERNKLFWETCLEVGLPINYSKKMLCFKK
ncbi:hypothetical protein NMG60_11025178 [Bertholletia excelsa]